MVVVPHHHPLPRESYQQSEKTDYKPRRQPARPTAALHDTEDVLGRSEVQPPW